MKKSNQANQLPDLEPILSSGQQPDTLSAETATTGELRFFQHLEMARSLISKNHLQAALAMLQELQPQASSEVAEVYVEEMRIFLMQGKWQSTLALSDRIVRTSAVVSPTLLTCYQMRGHAYLIAGDFEMATLSLAKALDLATLFPHQRSAFSALGFMVIALSRMGDLESAARHMALLREKIGTIENLDQRVDRLLMLTRAEFHYFKAVDDVAQSHEALVESKEISFWLGEENTFKKCIQDLQILALRGQAQRKSQTVSVFQGWSYLKRHQLILSLIPKSATSIVPLPQAQKALNALASGPLHESDFFEKIWSLKFSPKHHSQHLRSSLFNIRRLLPAQALAHKDQLISLK